MDTPTDQEHACKHAAYSMLGACINHGYDCLRGLSPSQAAQKVPMRKPSTVILVVSAYYVIRPVLAYTQADSGTSPAHIHMKVPTRTWCKLLMIHLSLRHSPCQLLLLLKSAAASRAHS